MNLDPANKIQLLPEHLIDQIKAGEVIERPSALIKELVENSIDANSTQIDIHIINHGMDLISIVDNGNGISFNDLPFAFCRHATSKISKFEDLYALHSFGFRGEALASIAAVSRLSCSSSPAYSPENAGQIVIHGGEEISHIKRTTAQSGTSIFIKDLFFNTPARLKFVKSKISEKNALRKILYSFILTNPEVSFSIKWDEKEKEVFPAIDPNDNKKRIQKIFFKKNNPNNELMSFSNDYEGHYLTASFSYDKSKGNAGKKQFLFINGRMFYDKRLHLAIIRGLETFWGYGHYGHYILSINAPADQIDVNVHPNKTEIKFLQSSIIYSLLSSGISTKLRQLKEQSGNRPGTPNLFDSPNTFSMDNFSFGTTNNHYATNSSLDQRSYPEVSSDPTQVESEVLTISKTLFSYNGYLGSCLKLFATYWQYKTSKKMPLDERTMTPLLISEPFKISKSFDQHIPNLKIIGFDFDRLDSDTIVLRSLPYFLGTFQAQLFLYPFITFLEKKNESDIFKLLTEFCRDLFMQINIYLNQNQISALIQDVPISLLIDCNTLISMDSPKISEVFGG